jgi:rhamnosyltransferase
VGLGFGISSVCAEAYYDSYPALIFFDQDTVFDRSTLDFIEDFYICNFSITHNYSAIVFNSKNIDCVGTGEGNNKFIFKDVLISINSGSLYFLENLKKINWHNETYFVDGVDYEFCLNSNNNNLKIGECSQTPGFDHEAEQGSIKYKICNRLFSTRVYSLTRIIDATVASLRLLIKSIKTMNFSFALKISRLLTGYFAHQLIARIVNCSSSKKECLNGFKRKI